MWRCKTNRDLIYELRSELLAKDRRESEIIQGAENRIMEKKWEVFKTKPFKYEPKFKVLIWIIFKCEKKKREWCGYQIPQYIDRIRDEYQIINFETGELKTVEEDFINDLVNCIT